MKLALGQINTVIGDFHGNTEKILLTSREARLRGADLVVFPELCICGYPPMDLLDYRDFIDHNMRSLRHIAEELPEGITAVVGHVSRNTTESGKPLRNAASVVSGGKVLHTQYKTFLPTYDVFDEARYFEPAEMYGTFSVQGVTVGIAVCEDIWREKETGEGSSGVSPVDRLVVQGAELLVVPSASPFYSGKTAIRRDIVADIVSRHRIPVAYINMAGGNDSIIFDGNSFLMTPLGGYGKAASFREDLLILDPFEALESEPLVPEDKAAEWATALAFGLSEYTRRCGFQRVHLGLSGGIDSAVVACIAVDALGPEAVTALAMPSRYSSRESLEDARELAGFLGIRLEILPIEGMFSAGLTTLSTLFAGLESDVTEENLQARIRGMLLMAFSNKFSSLLLETGNKSELATGYCTLYGDMCGGLAPIGDLFKTEVYALARFYNRFERRIPGRIITKPPSAELRPDQKDEDSLPPYEILDALLEEYLMKNTPAEDLEAQGFPVETIRQVLRLVARSEYKRLQAPPVLKVSPRAFGSGRRIPVARWIYEV
ncbi:MAG: NAD+ synthase [Spirochaetales bacterium]|nr:NAD+ synthase [Spirochaetales bacterium]